MSHSSELLSTLMNCCSINRKYSSRLEVNYTLKLFSNHVSDKQKWHQESLVAKSLGYRVSVDQIKNAYLPVVNIESATHRKIVIIDEYILPVKIGHTMTSFARPQSMKSLPELTETIQKLNGMDLIIDKQCRPITKDDWDAMNFANHW